jgi:phenylacetate-CoA ligase
LTVGHKFVVAYIKEQVCALKGASAFSVIETLPAATVRQIQETMLLEQLTYLRANSKFYRRRFAEAGIEWDSIGSISDLATLPFTLKQDLRDSLKAEPPFGEHLAAPLANIAQMQASSGTTGSPSYVALTESDMIRWQESSARSLFACGVRPGDRVLHALSLSKGFVGGLPVFQAIQYMGALDIPIGADGGVDRLLVACRDLRPRIVVGTPNYLAYLGSIVEQTIGVAARDLGVERLVVGGEPGGGIPALRKQLEELWGAKVTEMMGGTDLGVMFWAECDHQRGMHLVSPDHILCELIDPTSGTVIPFEKGTSGELVYTALRRQATPLLRFRSGDHIYVTDTECTCGRIGPLIRCVGRTDDMLIVRGVNLFPSAIQDIIGEFQPRASGTLRVLADFPGHSTQHNLTVLVERGQGADIENDLSLKSDIEQRVRNRLSAKVDVEIVPYDTFEKPGVRKVAITIRQRPST